MDDGRILSGVSGETCFVRLEGDLRFSLANRFEAFIRSMFRDTRFSRFTVDLTAATHMDSTMLGLTARIARCAAAGKHARPLLLSTQEDIDLLLDTMGFDAEFDIRHEAAEDAPPLDEIRRADDPALLPQNVLNAHRDLMDMNDRNQRVFGATVDMLEREIGSSGDRDAE